MQTDVLATADRRSLLESKLNGDADRTLKAICDGARDVLDLSGAHILLRCSRTHFTSVCATDELAARLLDLELSNGEGPAISACTAEHLVEAKDLSGSGGQWSRFSPLARVTGIEAQFSFPLLLADTSFGALSFFRETAGALTPRQMEDGYVLASLVSDAVLALPPGATMEGFGEPPRNPLSIDAVVHQATGVVASQAAMKVADAFVVLKFHAFATDASLSALARQVVAGEVFFDPQRYAMCVAS